MNAWNLTTLGEFCEITMGQSPAAAVVNRERRGMPLLNGPTEFGNLHPVPAQWASQYSKQARAGDLLFCVRGSTTGRMNWADQDYAIGRGLASVRGQDDGDTRIAKAVIELRLNALLQQASGSTFPNVSKSQLGAIEFKCPPRDERKRIAEVLAAFDGLVETNRLLALDLEDLARATVARVENVVPLHSISSIPRLRQWKPEGTVDHYSIPAFDSSLLPSLESSETILSGKQVLTRDSVLVSRLNPRTERTWMAYPREGVPAVCSPEFAVIQGADDVPPEVLWALVSRPEFWEQMRGAVGGTTNSRQRVDKATIPSFEVPDARELDSHSLQAIAFVVRSAVELRAEAATVEQQRDAILPMLMSGKARVRDLKAVV